MQKHLFHANIKKHEAQRLMFLFPQIVQQKAFAGRTKGRHLNPMFNATGDDNETVLHPNAPETVEHPFGRSVRSAPTTNGATYHLEWSHGCRTLDDTDPVYLEIVSGRPRCYTFIVRPSKTPDRVDNFAIVRLTHVGDRGGVKLKVDGVGKSHSFTIRQDDIHANGWAIWAQDDHKFDGCAHFDGESTTVWETRKAFLAGIQEVQDGNEATDLGTDLVAHIATLHEIVDLDALDPKPEKVMSATRRAAGGGGRR